MSHPAVAEAAAVAMPDRYAGEVPALFVVLRTGNDSSGDALDTHLRATLAEPHAMPAAVLPVAALPLTSVGKLSRVELRRRAAHHAVELALAGHPDALAGIRVEMADDGRAHVTLPPGPDTGTIASKLEELGLVCGVSRTETA